MLTLTLLAGSGAAIGALSRFGIMRIMAPLNTRYVLPLATLLINLTGSFLLGIVLTQAWPTTWQIFLGTGILGGYTTFSTMINEVVLLSRNEHRQVAGYYLALSVIGGISLAWLGTLL